jgi:hypothetical protein
MAIIGPSAFVLYAQQPDAWRRTVNGWEYAHAIQIRNNTVNVDGNSSSEHRVSLERNRVISKWHRIAFPASVGVFMMTFCWWLLIGVENRGIVRQFSKVGRC